MKKVTAYDVGGNLFKDKKAAEAAEKELAALKARQALLKKRNSLLEQLKKIETELGVARTGPEKGIEKEIVDRMAENIKKDADKEAMEKLDDISLDEFDRLNMKADKTPEEFRKWDKKRHQCLFQAGDRVRPRSGNSEMLWEGVVTDTIESSSGTKCVVRRDGGELLAYATRLELVSRPVHPGARFKVGDRIKILGRKWVELTGATGRIFNIEGGNGTPLIYVVQLDKNKLYTRCAEIDMQEIDVEDAKREARETGKPVVTASQTKFKVGDRVRLINIGADLNNRLGTVRGVADDNYYYVLVDGQQGEMGLPNKYITRMR